MPFNATCILMPYAKKAKENCVVSYHCLDNARFPYPGNVKCVLGAWDYDGTDPECKGAIIYTSRLPIFLDIAV